MALGELPSLRGESLTFLPPGGAEITSEGELGNIGVNVELEVWRDLPSGPSSAFG